MKQTVKRGLALLMTVVMCLSLIPTMALTASAAKVDYVYGTGEYSACIYNWGTRGETATSLSQNAESFYTDTTYEYLSTLTGGTGTIDAPDSELYAALQTLMESNHQKITTYSETKSLFQFTDCQNGGGKISAFYSGAEVGPEWNGSWNREHTWPDSKGDASGDGENDIMMLRPTTTSENSSRGNKAYGESSGYYNPNTVSGGTYNLHGDVARIMLYVYVRWGNTEKMWGSEGVIESLSVLLKWMTEDPVDTWEMGRNDSVESITGTRNVFVDYPELAFRLFGEAVPANIISPSYAATHEGHTLSHTVTAPTCTEEGYTTYTCSCGVRYMGDKLAATGHSYVDGTCSVCGDTETAANTATLITNVSDLNAGDRIIIVATGYDMALGTNQKPNNRGPATITKSGNTVTYGEDTQVITVETGTTAGTFAFNVGNGYLYAAGGTSTNNYLKTETSKSDAGSWTITIDFSGVATIKAGGNVTRNWMRYNSSSNLFSCYGSGQADIAIYVLPSCAHNWENATCKDPKTCSVCGATEGEKSNEHSYVNGTCTICGQADPNASGETTNTTVAVSIADYADANGWTNGTQYPSLKMDDVVTVTASGGQNTGKYYTKGEQWRMYQTEAPSIVVSGGDKTIVSVKITYVAEKTGALTYNGVNVASGTKVDVNATSATFGVGNTGTATNGQVRITAIEVVYENGNEPECQHDWDNATCTLPKTCSKCGETEGEALGHSWNNATCEAPKTCGTCGATEGSALGHSYAKSMTTAPTCTNAGIVIYTCTRCGGTSASAIPAPGHTLVNGVCVICGDDGQPSEGKNPAQLCGGGKDCILHAFSDINVGAWYHDGVHYCVEHALFQGLPGGKFGPTETTTRAQLITILWRLEGSPMVNYLMDFDDVESEQWYTEAVRWAAAEKIVGGYGNGLFGINDAITREQTATILWRYAQYKKQDVSVGENTNILSYGDVAQVNEYAIPAMQWACGAGLIQGIAADNTMNLDPTGSANRAQVATILYRYCEEFAK